MIGRSLQMVRASTNAPALERARSVPPKTVYYLFTQAGGRCEFRGCNAYLLEHHVTGDLGNYGEKGHIYAFKQSGPRGVAADRPDDIHDIANLILLCHACHKLVDVERPAEYPVARLRRFKLEHEDRIFLLTSLSENRKTVPIIFKGLVAGRDMQISNKEIADAVFPPNAPPFLCGIAKGDCWVILGIIIL